LSLGLRLAHELKVVVATTAFFAAWFLLLMALKSLVLAEYAIRFSGVATALFGALIAAKAVIVLEHVPIAGPVARSPAWVEVVARTALYGFGILVVVLLEHAFETRHEHGGFVAALHEAVRGPKWPHVLAAAIGIAAGLLVYNALSVVRRNVGREGLRRMFARPMPPPAS
jgi:hypothetical protein